MARIEITRSNVLFDEERHEYWLDGKQLSGITSLIQRQLFPNEFDGIPEKILLAAAQYGTDVHRRCENFDSQWINDHTQEVLDYISICKENGLTHEASEYIVSDGSNYASQIDKLYRTGDDTFSIGDIKTYYGKLSGDKLEKCRWQLSIYAYLFELQNRKAKVDRLFIIHLRNKQKKDGTYDHISGIIYVDRIPSDICKDLLETALRGEEFINPYTVPSDICSEESQLRELITQKSEIEERLNALKSSIFTRMTELQVKTWALESGMRITRKLPTVRSSFDMKLFKSDNPQVDLEPYMKQSQVAGSLQIAF